jgi:hypothetical protein
MKKSTDLNSHNNPVDNSLTFNTQIANDYQSDSYGKGNAGAIINLPNLAETKKTRSRSRLKDQTFKNRTETNKGYELALVKQDDGKLIFVIKFNWFIYLVMDLCEIYVCFSSNFFRNH